MYTEAQLSKADFFKGKNPELMLDSLTGTINRFHIVNYVKDLISKHKSFYMVMADIDNFKQANDFYGHQFGDEILIQITNALIQEIGDCGFVGRYGGDEFIIVIDGNLTYDEIWVHLKSIISNVFRKEYEFEGNKILATCTMGAVDYPNNALTYEELFSKMDKTLYRGKHKGRDCFVIYSEAMHGKIDVSSRMSALTINDIMSVIYNSIDSGKSFEDKLHNAFNYLSDLIKIDQICFISRNGTEDYSINKTEKNVLSLEAIDTLAAEFNDAVLYTCNNYSLLEQEYKSLFLYCKQNGLKSIVLYKMKACNIDIGYLAFVDVNRKRIWQPDDRVLCEYTGSLLSMAYIIDKK